ncbi:RND family efflux transporter MFP subunit [Dyadobacter sp. BE34]|uniref:RND family efflux transporter MFP subunit n=1 Tax=Dyadobacter fermentans TaxID=94254 RepID=A0ABU1QX11_9BACT|nr:MULTISPECIES: efflux RND transporter periplasmic adaptor subunit [Dyadobacter]MDR6805699.1 RND family efflux transporter MFP subunit [Dyadobacter fermentans]MDR7042541.1 RND family efflux transporter MFP subunit [Dyadobacter sp. BE242]MDR7196853.1 RND family efflux transporter MFP subunit [Dyadobacter sp. BE34]MDR7215712.1 RND family efflux transporter MFP subunit [Dyadobacter sp. BE31]MDR7263248.1 RND family efflux transporter MFP subunit [Dyadobacter sp. BE32]
MRHIHQIAMTVLVAGAATVLQSCGSSRAEEEESKKAAAEASAGAAVVDAFPLKKEQLVSNIQIPGELIAYQQVDIYAKVSSFVKKLHVDVGSEVREGQLLATMEAPELTSQLITSESRLKSFEAIYQASKANYERLLETSKTPGTVSQNDLDVALAKQRSDLAQLDAARSASREITDTRNYLEIRAPFSGIISARNVSTGAYVGPSGKGSEFPLFTLVEQRKLRLVVSVPEQYTSYLKNQSQVTFKVKSLPNQNFPAKVSRLAGALDARLRSQRTEMDVINSDRKLLPGMITEVSIPLSGDVNTFAVPRTAVLNSTQGTYVIKVVDKRAVWVPVKTGSSSTEKTEIFGDVKEGDVLVKVANEEIRDNSDLKNVKQEAI